MGGGCFAFPAGFLPSVISSLLTQITEGAGGGGLGSRAPPLDPPLLKTSHESLPPKDPYIHTYIHSFIC